MATFPIGVFTIVVMIACKVILIVIELLCRWNLRSTAPLRWFDSTFALLAIILGGVSFVGLRNKGQNEADQCQSADADIVGDGVRATAWTQVGVLFFIASTGAFHSSKTAAKEIGAGLIVTHISLAIALLVPLARYQLSPVDAVLGAVILDAQGNSLSVQLVNKDTMASRMQVRLTVITQLLGLITEGVLVGLFTKNKLPPTDSCACFSVFWWAWFGNCPTSATALQPTQSVPFWIYFGYRAICTAHGGYFAETRAKVFDIADKWDRSSPCDPCDQCCRAGGEQNNDDLFHPSCRCHPCQSCQLCRVCGRKNRCGSQQNQAAADDGDKNNNRHDQQPVIASDVQCTASCDDCLRCPQCGYKDLRDEVLLSEVRFSDSTVTISANFLENGVLAILSMVSVEVTMKINAVQKTSSIYSVGQVTALTIAVGTSVRALWMFLLMFWRSNHIPYQLRSARAGASSTHQPNDVEAWIDSSNRQGNADDHPNPATEPDNANAGENSGSQRGGVEDHAGPSIEMDNLNPNGTATRSRGEVQESSGAPEDANHGLSQGD
ncbi:hypothetical protein GGR52DRAFT_486016 [Hypoxylon sp. FL1284]|nr:hypothetical protein GGR52DRAFT_486016 [Hypoxylon sp. FL1284]